MTKESTLSLKVSDKATGKLLPARFHFVQKGGNPYTTLSTKTPVKGAIPGIITGETYRQNLHWCRDENIQSLHLTTGEATFPVPAGHKKWDGVTLLL